MLFEIYKKYKFNKNADRISQNMLFTRWRLYFKHKMSQLCKNGFRGLADDVDFRPGAYAIGCLQISIGKRNVIRPNSMLLTDTPDKSELSIRIEDNGMIGSGVHIYVSNHRFDDLDTPFIDQGWYDSKHLKIEHGAWIGADVTILPGVIVGYHSVVGTGAVVTKSIPPHSLAVGNTAK